MTGRLWSQPQFKGNSIDIYEGETVLSAFSKLTQSLCAFHPYTIDLRSNERAPWVRRRMSVSFTKPELGGLSHPASYFSNRSPPPPCLQTRVGRFRQWAAWPISAGTTWRRWPGQPTLAKPTCVNFFSSLLCCFVGACARLGRLLFPLSPFLCSLCFQDQRGAVLYTGLNYTGLAFFMSPGPRFCCSCSSNPDLALT